jgi:hypothetical protein
MPRTEAQKRAWKKYRVKYEKRLVHLEISLVRGTDDDIISFLDNSTGKNKSQLVRSAVRNEMRMIKETIGKK